MEKNVDEVTPDMARKRCRNPALWKRSKEKRLKYSAKGLPSFPKCKHRKNLQCQLLTMRDIKRFHAAYYAAPEKEKQDAFLLKYCKVARPKRTRSGNQLPNPSAKRKPKNATYEYFVENEAGNKLSVCRDAFLGILDITKHRVIGVFTRFKKDGALVPIETRGGSRKDAYFHDKRESVISFIKGLKGVESHYARGKSERVYLQSELNITKLAKMYNGKQCEEGKNELVVKESYFRNVFNSNFNIGFKCPTTDECSTCLELDGRINLEKYEEVKNSLILKKTLHKKQAKSFFEYLKTKPDNCILLTFDVQKNLVLPKVSDQSAYYSRQLYCHNLTVVTGTSHDKLTPDKVSIYTWTENQAKKSSNEVASVVFNELKSKDFEGITSVRLVADGCAGQNKNRTIITMCAKWLLSYAPRQVKYIEVVYPVTGHSFLPSDRVFGLIERDLKKMKTIIKPEEYHTVFRQYGTVKIIGDDWRAYDWKEETEQYVKKPYQLHFQMSKIKRAIICKTNKGNTFVRGELSYNDNTGTAKSVTAKGKDLKKISPSLLPVGLPVNGNKLNDVKSLLSKHFGSQWQGMEQLQWYREVCEGPIGGDIENECECVNHVPEEEVAVLDILSE